MATIIKIQYNVTNPTIKVTYDVTNVTIGGQEIAPVYINMDYSSSSAVTVITSVGLTMPTGFSVANSPLTSSGTLAVTYSSGYSLPTTTKQSEWDQAYNDKINSASVTGTSTKTLTLNQQDGGTVTASWSDIDTGLTSVGLSMPSAFSVSNSPLTANGTISVTGSGTTLQYVRGDGSLATFPALTGYVPYTGATTNVDLGEYELKAGQLTLDVSPTGTAAVGTIRWNNTIGSSETTLKGGTVILKNGVDLVARIVNKVSPNTTLTKAAYQAVRVSGAQGQRLAVAFAQANNDNNSADTIGLVVETISTNQEGFIITVGQIEDINTTGSLQGETWVDGDVLYLSPTTPGAITNVKPVAPQHLVIIGYVEYAHAVHGKIYVKVMNGWELGELHDVNTTGATNGQVLKYNGSIWTPSSDVGITSLNGLNPTSQTFATGTSGTDFAISSLTDTHTFNLPTASATNRGALSSADWTTFNSKQNTLNGTGFVKISGTTISYDNSTYALDSAVVHNTGAETIAGTKTLSSAPKLSAGLLIADGSLSTLSGHLGIGGSSDGIIIKPSNAGTNNILFQTGGFGYTYTFPANSGTVALTSDIPSLSGYVTGTGTANRLTKWSATTGQIVNSNLSDGGTTIGNVNPTAGQYAVQFNGNTTTGQSYGLNIVAGTNATDIGLKVSNASGTVNHFYVYGDGKIQANNIPNATTDTDKFLVSDSGVLKYRTGAEVLSDIGGQSALTNPVTGTGTSGQVTYWNGSGSVTGSTGLTYNNSTGFLTVNNGNVSLTGSGNWYEVNNSAGGGLKNNSGDVYFDAVSSRIFFRTGTPVSERARITAAGRLLLGTTAESTNILEVVGTARISSSLTAGSFIKSGGTSSQYLMADGSTSTLTNPVTGTGTTNYLPKWTSGSALGNSLLQENSGSIGINGAAVPDTDDTRLQINGTTYSSLSLKSTSVNAIFRSHDPNSILYVGNISNHPIGFIVNNAEQMRLTSTGLGIGTTSPADKFVVSNGGAEGIHFNPSFLSQSYIYTYNRSTNAWVDMILQSLNMIFHTNGGTEKMRITSGGNVGISTSSPSQKLHIGGVGSAIAFDTTGAAGTTIIQTVSDYELSIKNNRGTSSEIIVGNEVLSFSTNSTERMRIKSNGRINFSSLPTSATGLSAGDIWNDGGTLKIV